MPEPIRGDIDSETRPIQPTFVLKNYAVLLAIHQPDGALKPRSVRMWRLVARITQVGRLVAQALKRTRPLARRALITARPERVRIRSRKPWVRLRFNILGWKVRFIVEFTAATKESGIYLIFETIASICTSPIPYAHRLILSQKLHWHFETDAVMG